MSALADRISTADRLAKRGLPSAAVAYAAALVDDHLSDLAFCLRQRMNLCRDHPWIPWLTLTELDERIGHGLDAVCHAEDLGTQGALNLPRDDPGDLAATLTVLAAGGPESAAALQRVLGSEGLPNTDATFEAAAVALTMRWDGDQPGRWRASLPQGPLGDALWLHVLSGDPRAAEAATKTATRLLAAEGPHRWVAVRSVGRLRVESARGALLPLAASGTGAVRREAVLALLRLGDPSALRAVAEGLSSSAWAWDAAAACADPKLAGHALSVVRREPTPRRIKRVALLGMPESMGFLLEAMAQPNLARAAAWGLHHLTGFDITEHGPVEPYCQIDPDEVEPEVLAAFDGFGEAEDDASDDPQPVPLRSSSPGEPPSAEAPPIATTLRVCRDPKRWTDALGDSGERFAEGRRYRLGHPLGPSVLIQQWCDNATPHWLRCIIVEELAIRWRIDLGVETWSACRHQRAALQRWQQTASDNGLDEATGAGGWAFSARPRTATGVSRGRPRGRD